MNSDELKQYAEIEALKVEALKYKNPYLLKQLPAWQVEKALNDIARQIREVVQ